MICILISYLIATWMRYNNRNDYGDKTLHYMVCVVFLLFCVIYSFLADWNRDFIKRGYFVELLSVIRSVAVIVICSLVIVFFLSWTHILSRFVVGNFVWIDILLTFMARIAFKRGLWSHISNEKNVTRVVTSGRRAYDIAVRIKCSGYDEDKILVRPDLDDAVKELFSTGGRKFAVANYTAVQPTRAALNRFIKGEGAAK